MRILLVEDEADLRQHIAESLTSQGFVVDAVADGREALWLGREEDFDAIVLDLGLPQLDGISVLQGLREAGRGAPVLILTARSRWADKLAGFGAGADDYLTKPFEMDELAVRLKALIRRASGSASPILKCGPLSLDTLACHFRLDGAQVQFTPAESRLLTYLIHHAGRSISRTELSEHIYDRDFDLDSNVIDVLIGRIRRKLAPHTLIHTERGIGFRMAE